MAESTLYNDMAGWDKVWVNPNHTTGFAAQTLSLDLSNYTWLLIGVRVIGEVNDTIAGLYYLVPVDTTSGDAIPRTMLQVPSAAFYSTSSTATPYFYTRSCTASPTGVTFSTGYRKVTNANTKASSSTTYVVPIVIYAK